MDSKQFLLILWGKMGVEIVGSVDSSLLYFPFWPVPSKMISPKIFLISSGVVLDHIRVFSETFHFCAFLTMLKVRLLSK